MKTELLLPIEASGRHVHLSQHDMEVLFGSGFEMEKIRPLGGGNFLTPHKVKVAASNGRSCICSVLGPCRKISQVEVSYTEARAIGLVPPLGDTGNDYNWDPITIVGPEGEVHLERGIFVARRHVHLPIELAEILGVQEDDDVDLRIPGERPTTFHGVKVRIPPKGVHDTVIHLDYDEYNAAAIFNCKEGYISKPSSQTDEAPNDPALE